MTRKWLRYVVAYAVWILLLALGLWFWSVSRSALISILARLADGELLRVWRARLVDQGYTVVIGLAWVSLAILSESYLRNGVQAGAGRDGVLARSARLLGIEFLCIGAADLVLFVFQGPFSLAWLRWVILVVELAAGLFLTMWYRAQRRRARGRHGV
jgi:hypothetical protein